MSCFHCPYENKSTTSETNAYHLHFISTEFPTHGLIGFHQEARIPLSILGWRNLKSPPPQIKNHTPSTRYLVGSQKFSSSILMGELGGVHSTLCVCFLICKMKLCDLYLWKVSCQGRKMPHVTTGCCWNILGVLVSFQTILYLSYYSHRGFLALSLY